MRNALEKFHGLHLAKKHGSLKPVVRQWLNFCQQLYYSGDESGVSSQLVWAGKPMVLHKTCCINVVLPASVRRQKNRGPLVTNFPKLVFQCTKEIATWRSLWATEPMKRRFIRGQA